MYVSDLWLTQSHPPIGFRPPAGFALYRMAQHSPHFSSSHREVWCRGQRGPAQWQRHLLVCGLCLLWWTKGTENKTWYHSLTVTQERYRGVFSSQSFTTCIMTLGISLYRSQVFCPKLTTILDCLACSPNNEFKLSCKVSSHIEQMSSYPASEREQTFR